MDDPAYNRPVQLPHPHSAERLWRDDHVYDVIIVLGDNDSPPLVPRGMITADAQLRGGRVMSLKPAVDEALTLGGCEAIHSVIVYRRAGCDTAWNAARDVWWHDLVAHQSAECEPEWVGAEHPLFMY